MKIAVLAGGLSPEREVSLSSGSLIANALAERGHLTALADVYFGIPAGTDPESLFTSGQRPVYKIGNKAPDLAAVKAAAGGREALIGDGIIELCRAADVVFIALHGAMGENGMLQATLDCCGIRHYTGTGYVGALLSMDKDIAKKLMSGAGVPVPEGIYFDVRTGDPGLIAEKIGFPCVIKPVSCGSSVGVSRVFSERELQAAIAAASVYEDMLLAEKMIQGRELTCAILDGRALPPVEIIPKSGWYDYSNKYKSGAVSEICPAGITPEQTAEISRLAELAFSALRMEMYGRADFILDGEGNFYCLEMNALPGMTPTSLLPKEAAAAGIGYADLCCMLAELAAMK
ncbi:MAG: D-alanine--D-alanine ligase [Clostridia bacterium]|nr:D-alanine--D-alanine ligase [Clostridia bacterium]